jgi:hypothetical protein
VWVCVCGGGGTQSSCRCGWGVELVPVQMWVGGGVGPGADVGGYEPSPVVSDERCPKAQMRAKGRAVPSCAALHRHCAATDAAACNCRWSDAAGRCIAAGCAAMQPAPLCPVGPTLGVLKGVATGCAAMQQAIMLRSNRPCSVAVAAARRCVCLCVRTGPQEGDRPLFSGKRPN